MQVADDDRRGRARQLDQAARPAVFVLDPVRLVLQHGVDRPQQLQRPRRRQGGDGAAEQLLDLDQGIVANRRQSLAQIEILAPHQADPVDLIERRQHQVAAVIGHRQMPFGNVLGKVENLVEFLVGPADVDGVADPDAGKTVHRRGMAVFRQVDQPVFLDRLLADPEGDLRRKAEAEFTEQHIEGLAVMGDPAAALEPPDLVGQGQPCRRRPQTNQPFPARQGLEAGSGRAGDDRPGGDVGGVVLVDPHRRLVQSLADIDMDPGPVHVEGDFTVDGDLQFHHFQGQVVVDGEIALALPGLALAEDDLGIGDQEFEDVAVPPVRRKQAAAGGRDLDAGKFERRPGLAVEILLVEHRQPLGHPGKRQTEMDLPGPVDQRLVFPPVVVGEIDVALVGPPPYLIDVIRFSGTGRAGDDELEKFQTDRQGNPPDVLEFLDRAENFFQGIIHRDHHSKGFMIRKRAGGLGKSPHCLSPACRGRVQCFSVNHHTTAPPSSGRTDTSSYHAGQQKTRKPFQAAGRSGR